MEPKIDKLLCDGNSLVKINTYARTDYVGGDGSNQGYMILTTKSGDQMFLQYSGNSQLKTGEKLADNQSTGRFIGGTGALASVEGDYQSLGKMNRKKAIFNGIIDKIRYKVQ